MADRQHPRIWFPRIDGNGVDGYTIDALTIDSVAETAREDWTNLHLRGLSDVLTVRGSPKMAMHVIAAHISASHIDA